MGGGVLCFSNKLQSLSVDYISHEALSVVFQEVLANEGTHSASVRLTIMAV